jgi:hypothetical protein
MHGVSLALLGAWTILDDYLVQKVFIALSCGRGQTGFSRMLTLRASGNQLVEGQLSEDLPALSVSIRTHRRRGVQCAQYMSHSYILDCNPLA